MNRYSSNPAASGQIPRTATCCVLATLMLMATAVSAFAQDADDKRLLVIRRGAELQSSGETVGESHYGAVLTFTNENGSWKWIPEEKGWINDRDTIPLATAVDTFTEQLRKNPQNTEALINRAAAWRVYNEREKAISDLDEAIRLDDDNALAFMLRGICHSEMQNSDPAIADCKRAIQLDSKYLRPRLIMSVSLRAKGDAAAAVEQLSEVIRQDATNETAYLLRGQAWADRGELDIALSDFNETIRLSPNSGEAYRIRASLWRLQQNFQKELNDLNEALRIDSQDSVALYWRGNLWMHQGDLDQAIADLTQVVTIDPASAPGFNLRAIAKEKKNEIAESLTDYDAAIRLQPANTVYLMNRADTLQKVGELQKAWNDITSALNLYQELGNISARTQAAAWIARSGVLRQARQDDDALSDLNEAIRVYPESSDAFNRRGLIYEARREYDTALKDYQESARLDPANAFPWFNMGDVHRVNGRDQEAYDAYTKAIELNPQYAVAYNNRGLIWESIQKFDEALADYNAALKINPNYVPALINRGDVWRAKLEPQNAVNDYTAAIALNDGAAHVYVSRARAWFVLGDQESLQKGLEDCNKAISLNDNFDTAYAFRGLIRRNLGTDRDSAAAAAIEDFTAAIAVNPRYVGAFNERGATRSQLGYFSEAIADFNASLQIDPNNVMALRSRGAAYRQLGESASALKDLNAALAIDQTDAAALLERGLVHTDLAEYSDAVTNLRQALEHDPENPLAHNHLARLLATVPEDGLRDGEQALVHATTALEWAGEDNTEYLGTLAAVHAELGDFDKAIEIQTQLADRGSSNEQELESYRQGRPYRIGAELPIEIEPYPEVEAVTPVANAIRIEFVPAEAFAAIVMRPSEILADKLLSQFPVDAFAEELMGNVPIDPANLEEVVVVMFPHKKVPPGFLLRLHEPASEDADHLIGDLMESSIETVELSGRRCLSDGISAVCRVDSRTFLTGPVSAVSRMLAADQTPSVLKNRLQQTEAGTPFIASVALRVCPGFLGSVSAEAPPPVREPMTLLTQGSELNLQLTLDPVPALSVDADMQDAESAARLNLEVIRGIGMLTAMTDSLHEQWAPMLPDSLGDELHEMVGSMLASASPVMSRTTVSVSVSTPETLPQWLEKAGPMIEAAIGAARGAAQESRAVGNLKQIATGFHLSHDTYGHFPARAMTDDAGQPLLSWRVHLLPYLEHQELYEQFHLNEPWDSEHNRLLISRMPDVFQGSQHRSDGRTSFVVPVGPGTIFETPENLKLSDIPDGTSSTVLVLDVGPANAVEWTRPDSSNFDPADPLSLLSEELEEVHIGFADGYTTTIPRSVAEEALPALLTRNGGETVELD